MIQVIVSVAIVLSGFLLMLDLRKSSATVAALAISGGYISRWISTGADSREVVAEIVFISAVAIVCVYAAKAFLEITDRDSKQR